MGVGYWSVADVDVPVMKMLFRKVPVCQRWLMVRVELSKCAGGISEDVETLHVIVSFELVKNISLENLYSPALTSAFPILCLVSICLK